MPACPKGHTSVAADYCDECGTPIASPPSPAAASPSSPSTAAPSPAAESQGSPAQACPDCGAARDGRFCEVCGHDFLAAHAPPGAAAPPSPTAAAPPNEPAPAGEPAPAAPPDAWASAARWRVVVTADRAYHARMEAAADADAERLAYPAFCPERRFDLSDDQVLIGRRSRSRGIEPAVDLTGPPEDAGVSHTHALLVRSPEGAWSVVDLGSANGTFVNDGTDPIAPNEPVPLADGDRVHVGAWTTLTLRAG